MQLSLHLSISLSPSLTLFLTLTHRMALLLTPGLRDPGTSFNSSRRRRASVDQNINTRLVTVSRMQTVIITWAPGVGIEPVRADAQSVNQDESRRPEEAGR